MTMISRLALTAILVTMAFGTAQAQVTSSDVTLPGGVWCTGTWDGDFAKFENCASNFSNTISGNVGVTEVSVYVSHVGYSNGKESPRYTSPTGTGQAAPSNFTFPGLNQFGLVFFWREPTGQITAANITATDRASAQKFNLGSNASAIYVVMNDQVGAYDDNWGAFDIYINYNP